MYLAKCKGGYDWTKGELLPYGPIELEPASTVLSYGQAIFEGIKAHRTSKGRIIVFRPEENMKRMREGAERLMMPPPSKEVFMDMIDRLTIANAHWVPPVGMGALYFRPMLYGCGAKLGVAPSSDYHFLTYVSPVGAYFKSGIELGTGLA